MIKTNYTGVHEQYPLFLPDFNKTWIFTKYFWRMLKYQISWKSVHADGQTWHT